MARKQSAKGRKRKSPVAGKKKIESVAPARPSGAAFRKQRKERERNEQIASGDADALTDAYRACGPAPKAEPHLAMGWVRTLQLVALEHFVADPANTPKEKFRAIKEMADSIGKTRIPEAVERELAELKKKLHEIDERSTALQTARASEVPRAPTARAPKSATPDEPPPQGAESNAVACEGNPTPEGADRGS